MKSLMSLLGKGLAIVVVGAYGFGFLIETGYAPSDRVQTHEEIGDKHMQVLLDEGIIGKDEHIQHFYSEGLLSVRGGGSVLTDRRVITYQEWDDEVQIFDLTFDEVVSIEKTQEGTALDYAVYVVSGAGEDNYVELWLPHDYGDADRFMNALQANVGN
jgi:hypothetical protein